MTFIAAAIISLALLYATSPGYGSNLGLRAVATEEQIKRTSLLTTKALLTKGKSPNLGLRAALRNFNEGGVDTGKEEFIQFADVTYETSTPEKTGPEGLAPDTTLASLEMTPNNLAQLHDWLEEDGSDGTFKLLYSSSRDGLSAAEFHAKCDGVGATLSLIETTDGLVVGGYSNTPWESKKGWQSANRAFLFALSGGGLTTPVKLHLKDPNDGHAVYHRSPWGPAFGGGRTRPDRIKTRRPDLAIYRNMTKVFSHQSPGSTYEDSPSWPLKGGVDYDVTQVKVFLVSGL